MPSCDYCKERLTELPFKCKRCGGEYCTKHRLPEDYNCPRLLWSREGKIGRCVSNIASEIGKVHVCDKLYGIFNDTGVGFGECLINYAVTTGDISACELSGMPKSRGFCKAKATGDYTECQKITCDISCSMENLEAQQGLCLLWFATESKNASLCNIIQSDAYNMKEICFNMTKSD